MLQPGSFDQVRQTISALAAYGAADRQVMSVALLGVGVCHVLTGLALRPAAWPGRVLLMTGGVATVLVAAFPVRAGAGRSVPHTVAAAVAFIALAAWPAGGGRRGAGLPWGLRAGVRHCLACSGGSMWSWARGACRWAWQSGWPRGRRRCGRWWWSSRAIGGSPWPGGLQPARPCDAITAGRAGREP
jgi:hypothetical protein